MARIDIKLVTGFSPQTQKDFVETTAETKEKLKAPKSKAEVETVRIENADTNEPIRFSLDDNEAQALFGLTFPETELKPGDFKDFKVTGSGKLGVITKPDRPGHDHTDLHIIC